MKPTRTIRPYLFDTIAAIATPPGTGGLGVVRVSGPAAPKILAKIFKDSDDIDVANMATHRLYYGRIKKGTAASEEVLAVIMRSPYSYTREDTAEIYSHGGYLIVKSVLEETLAAGARMADPGEFTKRAFLNGRLDLSQAEAVADIISAKTETALKVGLGQLSGSLSGEIKRIKSDLLDVLAQLEADIDYAEENLEILTRKELGNKIEKNKELLENLSRTYEKGKIIKEGITVAIIGKPNVGKSSLLNCLVREEKAIVTDLPGTTRDIVEEGIIIKGIRIRLLDTAGLRKAKNKIEQIGQQRTQKAVKQADLLLWIIDGSTKLSREDFFINKIVKDKNHITIINKIDLPMTIGKREIKALVSEEPVKFSALTGAGLHTLEAAIAEKAFKGRLTANFRETAILTSQRQFIALKQAIKQLTEASREARQGYGEEIIALSLRKGIGKLGEIVGEVVSEDILNIIFSKFCVGK